ncbi:MAG: acetate--CoA ligase family protein [Deltaproteobacteria bacterium]|nr:acetate--CoA ligase family protein [Deltaproteobacteria bacterium]
MAQGLELIVGAKQDPQFGTVVVVGIGGTAVEIYHDVAIRMAPVSPAEAISAITSIRGRKLLEGYRGAKPVNREKLAELIVNFSQMAFALRDEITSIDLNPVLCNPEQAVIADARFILPTVLSSIR